ncbi:DUF6912 family protein [Trueperella sp. LYQ143]|uniref:DUF6912 family protein n=1 Tax=Trueperella sp. LYQ143 TaxID=3391059 RepID=UPI0039838D60
MRLYIPLIASELAAPVSARIAHGVTARLRQAIPNEDDEGWEMIATLAAADDSLRLMSNAPHEQCRRRLVAIAETDVPCSDDPQLPTALQMSASVSWDQVVSILVDEPGQHALISQAIAGDEAAFLACGDIELLWYDVCERADLMRELGVSGELEN